MSIHVKDLPSTRAVALGKDAGYFPVAATTDGRHVVIVHRAGAGHMGVGGRLEALISEDAGDSWLDPVLVVQSEWDDRNPAIGVAPSGTIVVGYHRNKNYNEKGEYVHDLHGTETWLTRSRDGGRNWQEPYPLNIEELNGLSPYGQMLTLDDGSLLMPLYGNPGTGVEDEAAFSYLVRSTDEGLTWSHWSLVAEDMNESAFLLLPGGRIMAAMRGETKGTIHTAFADMRELKWTNPAEASQGHPASLAMLPGGQVLLVWGWRGAGSGARGYISTDDGKSWLKDREITFGDNATNWDCGYPTALYLPSQGRILVAYYTTAQEDPWRCEGAHCHVVVCSEKELLDAVGL